MNGLKEDDNKAAQIKHRRSVNTRGVGDMGINQGEKIRLQQWQPGRNSSHGGGEVKMA